MNKKIQLAAAVVAAFTISLSITTHAFAHTQWAQHASAGASTFALSAAKKPTVTQRTHTTRKRTRGSGTGSEVQH